MKLLADECCNAGLVEGLRHAGHDVVFAVESMRGASDSDVLRQAREDERILLPEDKDFGELVYRLHRRVPGVILLRFGPGQRALKRSRLLALLRQEAERLQQTFVVLDEDKARIRPLE